MALLRGRRHPASSADAVELQEAARSAKQPRERAEKRPEKREETR